MAFQLGAADFVTKPADPDHLVAILKQYSGASAAAEVAHD
jgi:DNA-binding response OmpR family regulator